MKIAGAAEKRPSLPSSPGHLCARRCTPLTDLVAALPSLDVNDLTHGCCGDGTSEAGEPGSGFQKREESLF